MTSVGKLPPPGSPTAAGLKPKAQAPVPQDAVAQSEKAVGEKRLQALFLRMMQRMVVLFKRHAFERSELVRRYGTEADSLCNQRDQAVKK